MSQSHATAPPPQATAQGKAPEKSTELVADLSLTETLRVLEVARGMRRQRSEAETALARQELREILRRRLLDAAAVTGDQVTEADVDQAIEQYFERLHAFEEPAPSWEVFFAKMYVRRTQVAMVLGAIAVAVTAWIAIF